MIPPSRPATPTSIPGEPTAQPSRTAEEEKRILEARARTVAQASQAEARPEPGIEFIAFQVGEERYGLESAYVREVIAIPELTWLPGVPEFIAGICNIRGRITSVVDLKRLLGLPLKGLSDFHTVVVARAGAMEMGLLVDRVLGIEQVRAEDLQPPLAVHGGAKKGWIKGLTPGQMALIDGKALVGDPKLVVQQEK